MSEPSTKPYLLRAIYEWCTDAGFTPYVAVAVDETVRVPVEFVKNDEIVLNVSALATNRLKIGNDAIEFQARFGGMPRDVYVPIQRVIAIYARENGQGMAFDVARPATQLGAGQDLAASDARTGPAFTGAVVGGVAAETPVPEGAREAEAPDGNRPPTPGAPKPGDRPRLTRVK